LRSEVQKLAGQGRKRIAHDCDRIRTALLVDQHMEVELELLDTSVYRFGGIFEHRSGHDHRLLVELGQPDEPVACPAAIARAVADADSDPFTESADAQHP